MIFNIFIFFFMILIASVHVVNSFVSFRGPKKRVKVSLIMKDVTVKNLDNNKEIVIAAGQPLSLAAVRSDMRLSFQCKQGTCQSCQVFLNGDHSQTHLIDSTLLIFNAFY